MSKLYSKEVLDKLSKEQYACIVIFHDDSVYAGRLAKNISFCPYHILPFSIHCNGMGFKRSHVKKIILFNGLIYPKEEHGEHKHIDIIEMSELLNKAGYEFI